MTTNQDPITVTFNVGIDTPISDRYVQTSEDGYAHAGQTTVLDLIVERAAQVLIQDVRRNDELYASVRQRVSTTRETMIRESLAGPIAEALASSVQRTNAYGVPAGEPLPMIEIVIEQAKQLLLGHPNNREKSLLVQTIDQEVTKAFKRELADELGAAKAEVRAAVKATAVTALTEAIAQQFGVR